MTSRFQFVTPGLAHVVGPTGNVPLLEKTIGEALVGYFFLFCRFFPLSDLSKGRSSS